MSLVDKCNDGMKALQASPTFAMSLGAKELFHTNFIAFLLESKEDTLVHLRCALRSALKFPVQLGESTSCVVWREKKNLDLILAPLMADESKPDDLKMSRERVHIVEAKLKSVPTSAQLKRYDEALAKGFKLLSDDGKGKALWLGSPKRNKASVVTKALLSTSGSPVRKGWNPVTWKEVSTAIRSNLPRDDASKLGAVLSDYAASLKHLTSLVSKARTLAKTLIREDRLYEEMLTEVQHETFKRMRLRDLVSKVMYDAWLKAETRKLVAVDGLTPEAYVLYTNSNPGIGIEYLVPSASGDQGLRIGVQIQDTEYRYYVAAFEDARTLEKVARSKPLSGWLWTKCSLGALQGKKPIGNSEPEKLRAFNRQRFVFRRTGIPPGCSFSQLSLALHESLELARTIARIPATSSLSNRLS